MSEHINWYNLTCSEYISLKNPTKVVRLAQPAPVNGDNGRTRIEMQGKQ